MSEQKRDDAGRFESAFTLEIAHSICAEIIDGKSLRTICKMDGMPSRRNVMFWLTQYAEFKELYDRACMERAEAYVEEIMDIADDGSNDWMENNDPENPGYRLNGEHVQRSRVRIDTRKWYATKVKPKKYGDKVEATHEAGDSLAALLQAIDGKSRTLPG